MMSALSEEIVSSDFVSISCSADAGPNFVLFLGRSVGGAIGPTEVR